MKKKLLSLLFVSSAIVASAQTSVPNNSFENWYDIGVKDSLEYWMTSTLQNQQAGNLDVVNTYEISNAYAGSAAVHMETVLYYNPGAGQNDTLFGYAIKENADGTGFHGFPYSDTVDVFSCWYKCGIVAGDQGVIIVELSENDVVYSTTVYPIIGTQNSWTQLIIPLVGGSAQAPDSVFVGFASSDPFNPGVAEPGSWLEIDEISFDFLAGSVVPAPIPNNGFENWIYETIEQPTDWFSFDQLIYPATGTLYATKSSTASDGLASLQIETTFENIMLGIPAIVTNGTFDYVNDSIVGGSAYYAQPATVSGMYQFAPSFVDTAFVVIDFWNSTSGVHHQYWDTLMSAGVWTPWTIDLTFPEAPDSVLMYFFSGANIGSVLLVDNIQFAGGDLAVVEIPQTSLSIYPNPASTVTTIQFEAADQIRIFDLSGKLIVSYSGLTDNQIELNTSEFQNGTYIVQIINNGYLSSQRFVVQH